MIMRLSDQERRSWVDTAEHVGVREAARRAGVSASTLTRWSRKYREEPLHDPTMGGPGGGYDHEDRLEVVKLAERIGVAGASRLSGISAYSIHRWQRQRTLDRSWLARIRKPGCRHQCHG